MPTKRELSTDVGVVDEIEIDREIYRRSFIDFARAAFEVVEGGDAGAEAVRQGKSKSRFVPGWHIDAIADHLQAVADGSIKRLLVNVPPGTSKSQMACVLWPTWLWARDPSVRFMFSSYSEVFTRRDCRKAKELVQSAWYRARFPHVVIKAAPDTAMEHHTTAGGERHGASTNSGVTGRHVHGICEDDSLKMQDAMSAKAREDVWTYRTQALGFRLLPEGGWRVVIMQRLHEDDPSGRILERRGKDHDDDPDAYVHLCLPMEFEPSRRCITYVKGAEFFRDPRTEDGELLWPERMDRAFVDEKKGPNGLGPVGWAGQGQQRPAPLAGNAVKREYLRERWTVLPEGLEDWMISADLTFKLSGTSYVAIGVWARKGAKRYLVDQVRERLDFPGQIEALLELRRRWPKVSQVLIEEAANGHAAISVLRNKVPGVIAVRPDKSKEARFAACLPNFEAGDVVLPHASVAPWVVEYEEELVTFPNAANDDQVDQTAQSLNRYRTMDQVAASMTVDLDFGITESMTQESAWKF